MKYRIIKINELQDDNIRYVVVSVSVISYIKQIQHALRCNKQHCIASSANGFYFIEDIHTPLYHLSRSSSDSIFRLFNKALEDQSTDDLDDIYLSKLSVPGNRLMNIYGFEIIFSLTTHKKCHRITITNQNLILEPACQDQNTKHFLSTSEASLQRLKEKSLSTSRKKK